MEKGPEAFRTISEVAEDLGLPQHVLRFWETRFPQIKPIKRGGGRRFYRPNDVDLLRGIKHLLYGEGYTIRGVQRILREQGQRRVASFAHGGAPAPDPRDGAPQEDEAALAPSLAGRASGPEFWAPARRAVPDEMDHLNATGASFDEPPPPAPAPALLSADRVRRLRAALAELDACRRLIEERL